MSEPGCGTIDMENACQACGRPLRTAVCEIMLSRTLGIISRTIGTFCVNPECSEYPPAKLRRDIDEHRRWLWGGADYKPPSRWARLRAWLRGRIKK